MISKIIMEGQDPLWLTESQYVIGRGEECDLLLPEDDSSVSRRHALLEQDESGSWRLADLKSTNGAFLNGERIKGSCKLNDGDTITIGKSRLRFVSPRSQPTVMTPLPDLPSILQRVDVQPDIPAVTPLGLEITSSPIPVLEQPGWSAQNRSAEVASLASELPHEIAPMPPVRLQERFSPAASWNQVENLPEPLQPEFAPPAPGPQIIADLAPPLNQESYSAPSYSPPPISRPEPFHSREAMSPQALVAAPPGPLPFYPPTPAAAGPLSQPVPYGMTPGAPLAYGMPPGMLGTVCPQCRNAVQPGTRWCAICRSSVVNPAHGRLAPPIKRLGAFVIDFVIPNAVLLSIIILGAATAGLGMILWIPYAIFALILFCQGTTPGKRMLGMTVIKPDGMPAGFFTMLIRECIGKYLSGFILLLGYLWILIDKDHQAWHDKLVSTYVVEGRG